jgi:hypothetical protein
MARNFQTIIKVENVAKPMKMSFATEDAALTDIANTAAAASSYLAERWGKVTSAVILNKATGETIPVI